MAAVRSQPTARISVLDHPGTRRPDGSSSRTGGVLTARLVAFVLVLLSLALVTISFREDPDGVLHSAQRAALSALAPLEAAGERVARPFRDAWGYASGLFAAKAENERLKRELETLRQQAVENENAARENEDLRALLRFRDGPRFPAGYQGVATRVIARPPSIYSSQEVLIAAGSSDGVRVNDPVVTEDGLVGRVAEVTSNASKVTLLIDQASAVSAVVLQSGAAGIVRHGPSGGSTLVLDRVPKEELVSEGDTVITAGWQSGKLESLYPRGIPVGTVTGVGQQDVDVYKRIQVTSLVDFDSLSGVIVLVQPGKR
jgi:rod shape-determining protein MreC